MSEKENWGKIELKPLNISHRDIVYDMARDEEVTKFLYFGAVNTRERAEQLIREYTAPGNSGYLIELEGAGAVGVSAWKKGKAEGVYSLSVFLGKAVWGKGLGKRVSAEMLLEAHRLGAKILEAYVDEDNIASCRMLESLGFATADTFTMEDGERTVRRMIMENVRK